MYIRRLLQIHVVMIAALGTLALGLGQRDATLPMAMLAAAVTALWVTDILGIFRISWAVANLVAGGVLLFVLLWHLTHLRGTALVLGIANVLAYLEMVLLFQEKDARTCWLILLLSLLQVIVAAVLNQGYWFGLLLVVYVATAVSTLVLLCLHQQRAAVRSAVSPLQPVEVGSPHGAVVASGFDSVLATSSGRSVRLGKLQRLTMRLAAQVFGLAVVLFLLVPRPGIAPWRGVLVRPVRAIGFSGTVRLGELGAAIENPQEVCRIRLTRFDDDQPYRVSGSIYLRGAILVQYGNGRWHRPPVKVGGEPEVVHAEQLEPIGELVRQRILAEPLDRQELFCVWPFANMRANQGLLLDQSGQLLLRAEKLKRYRFSFELVTPAFHRGMQMQLVPVWHMPDLAAASALPNGINGKRLPGLVATARRWLDEAGLQRSDPYGIMRLFEHQLRNSGRFQYSLEPQRRQWNLDPIEDFVTHNRRGHCEYFATALALMLRSQGIPSRVVLGFRTEEWNPLGQFYQVRQLHAHTWVEAFLWRNQVPEDLLANDPLWRNACGAWLRLDPTPAAEAGTSARLWTAASRWLDWLDFAWVNYVVEMDQSRQQRTVYRPLVAPVVEAVHNLLEPQWWQRAWASFRSRVARAWQAFRAGHWFNWQGGLIAVLAMLLLALLGWMVRILFGRVFRMMGRKRTTFAAHDSRVAFYGRLESALARRGLRRSRWQTQREFAAAAGKQLADLTGLPRLAELLVTVAEAYYRVRFGGSELDSRQIETVEQAVRQVESVAGTPLAPDARPTRAGRPETWPERSNQP